MRDYFFCYDSKVSAYLRRKGNRYITVAIHPDTRRKFWLFRQSKELTEALAEIQVKQ
jgi:hypothetical protein